MGGVWVFERGNGEEVVWLRKEEKWSGRLGGKVM
jgi:hypothetical protein